MLVLFAGSTYSAQSTNTDNSAVNDPGQSVMHSSQRVGVRCESRDSKGLPLGLPVSFARETLRSTHRIYRLRFKVGPSVVSKLTQISA